VSAWTWSLSDNNDNLSTGPRVSGHTTACVATKSPTSTTKNDKIFLFGGHIPEDDSAPQPDIIGGAGASAVSYSSKASRASTPLEARAESARVAAAAAAGQPPEGEDPLHATTTITATHDLWVYEKDKSNGAEDWELISRKAQGVSRPTPRTHAATAVLGHMMYLFGGYDPSTGKNLSDVWTLSMKTNKWSLTQAWMPFEVSKHSACAISATQIAIHTHKGTYVYDHAGPTPTVLEQPTTGEGPDGLSLCASCGISRTDSTGSNTGNDNLIIGGSTLSHDMLIFGGSTGEKLGFSSAAFVLNTKSWSWTKLLPKTSSPRSLQSPSIASVGNNQCIVFGGAALKNSNPNLVIPSDETWLLTVDGNSANWEQIAVDSEGSASHDNNDNQSITPDGRLAASLTATTSEELVLQGGYDPISKKTYGAGGRGTWILTKNPIDLALARQKKKEARQKSKDAKLSGAEAAAKRASDIIAQAGSGMGFDGTTLGVGGLDDVLEEIKTRIWTPLAAPPQLLKELGIQPTRGLLLYGGPGCGKTLLASTLGSMLSPFRPITVVNGPEILDKFVGSSEANLREIFDNPPDIYEHFRRNETDGGDAMSRAAIHIVVMDEFDAVARARGGGGGGQGDAGVARDSVVNQLLSKMDGVQPLVVPTLVIGLTNKRSLIDPALLRPGRFEVQIEITPPKTDAQRRSILIVHTQQMFDAGRLQVNDPPPGSAAAHQLEKTNNLNILTYDQLTKKLAIDCDGFSGAAIAGVTRAAASRALARAVGQLSGDLAYSSDNDSPTSIMDCLVTQDDFYQAVNDLRRDTSGTSDQAEDEAVVSGIEDRQDGRVGGFRTRLRQWWR